MTASSERLYIERLGQRGEGMSRSEKGVIFVPYALAGETVLAEIEGEHGQLVAISHPSHDRIDAHCPYFSTCGGCAVQTLSPTAYAQWKRDLVVEALRRAGIAAKVGPLVDAHGDGRRRATFHIRADRSGRPLVGFMRARTHNVVEIDSCPVLEPSMSRALPALRALAEALRPIEKPLDALVTATKFGLDIDLRGQGRLDPLRVRNLVQITLGQDLVRLSNHGEIVLEPRLPVLGLGGAEIALPPGAFLQPTLAGETRIVAEVCGALAGAGRIADLFAGVGTIGLRLAEQAQVHAVDCDQAALDALAKARHSVEVKPVTTETRDLFRRPLRRDELGGYDGIVFDPPRAGAELQAKELAASIVPVVVAVSCNARTFARDAEILCAGGYEIEAIVPIDQFRHTPHVEIVATYRRVPQRSRSKRKILR
jgi:23S rRNA (uracil1939-C5)-methyltransferase